MEIPRVVPYDMRETNIYMTPGDEMMQVSSSDTYMRNRLRRMAEEEGSEWVIVYDDDLSTIAEAPKNLLTLRVKTRTLTPEQREKSAERLRAWREANED